MEDQIQTDFSHSFNWAVFNFYVFSTFNYFYFSPRLAHTPDNSFMGFVVDRYLPDDKNTSKIERKNQALVYGKQEYMWQVSDWIIVD